MPRRTAIAGKAAWLNLRAIAPPPSVFWSAPSLSTMKLN